MIDQELISECRKGHLNYFRKLVELVSPFAFSVAFRMLSDEELAKDVVQETMLTIWEKLDRIRAPESFKPWMYRIVVNKCYDLMRSRKRRPEFSPDESGWAVLANHISEENTTQMENSETARIINLLTNRLSPRQKAVFILCDIEEIPQDEVAEITGMSRMNIKANLHYARKKIGELIKKNIQDGDRK